MTYNHLKNSDIAQLTGQGCTATDWAQVLVSPHCDLNRLMNVSFSGTVSIGGTQGTHVVEGIEMPSGVYSASLADTEIGDHVRIANVGSVISNYAIEKDVIIQQVGAMIAEPEASFGNGVELETVNEGGGRGVRIINDLTSQTAYVQAMMRHDADFIKRLDQLIQAKAKESHSGKGRVGQGAKVIHCGTIRNVHIGTHAFIHGAQFLENGTISSCAEHPTEVGEGVQARSFIMLEGARIESGAILDKAFLGQGVKMGKQYSAENSLFFANCEAFHGEAVSVFAAPYTVTHHKSTLLIAGLFSFYNAGSGTNQSNHMYKLGPVHQGVLERGCKTGSFSYILLEAHIGAFSAVIGKHYANINAANLPFSYIFEDKSGSQIVPAMNLVSVGTVRDGEKWPKRDGRKAPNKRDLIVFDVFSPYTVEKMRRGRDELKSLQSATPKEKTAIEYGGGQVSRQRLDRGIQYYAHAVNRYLLEKVMDRITKALDQGGKWGNVSIALKSTTALHRASEWTDIGGLLTPIERMEEVENRMKKGLIPTYDALAAEFQRMYDKYREDEWQYICETFEGEFGFKPDAMTKEQALALADKWEGSAAFLLTLILEDSKKEFGDFARIGYGLDQTNENKKKDFEAVRGSIETNGVVQKLTGEAASIPQKRDQFKGLVTSGKS